MLDISPPQLIASAITLVIAFTVHEFAHAWAAKELGDRTAQMMGRLTLNPLVHLDPIGSLLLLVAGFGWAKPVPVNPYNLRFGPKMGMLLVAAAGPASNLVMALVAAIPVRMGIVGLSIFRVNSELLPSLAYILYVFIFINLSLMLFNLIPIPPLDGSKILRGVAPREWDSALDMLERWGPFALMGLMVMGRFGGTSIFNLVIGPPLDFLFNSLIG